MPNSLDDLSPDQIERLKKLARLTDKQIETMNNLIEKEASWTYVQSYVRSWALFIVAIITAIALTWDKFKSLVGLASSPPPTP